MIPDANNASELQEHAMQTLILRCEPRRRRGTPQDDDCVRSPYRLQCFRLPSPQAPRLERCRERNTPVQDSPAIAVDARSFHVAGQERWRALWRNVFPFLVVGAIWEIVAWSGLF